MAVNAQEQRGIDYEKLRSLNVPEEAIAALDARDGGNITPEGEVLFLDADRQKRKEQPNTPLRKDDTSRLRDGMAGVVSKAYARGIVTGKTLSKAVDMTERKADDPIAVAVYNLLGFGENGYNHINVIPLNVDVSEAAHSTVVPVDFMFQELEEAEYIAILHECVCRKTNGCKEHSHDLGCIFLNACGRAAVKNGLADKATVDQAKAHVLRAADEGLMGSTEFIEGEQLFWGVRNRDMHEYRMFCFCCDCCCLALRVVRDGSWDTTSRYTSVGWTAVCNHDACIGCRECAKRCPQHCISYREDGKCVIDQEKCLGCGFCKLACEQEAIKIKQTMPARDKLNDYYLLENRVDDQRPHAKAEHVDTDELREQLAARGVEIR